MKRPPPQAQRHAERQEEQEILDCVDRYEVAERVKLKIVRAASRRQGESGDHYHRRNQSDRRRPARLSEDSTGDPHDASVGRRTSPAVASPTRGGAYFNQSTCEDVRPQDGTHPSADGQRKVADLLVRFFETS